MCPAAIASRMAATPGLNLVHIASMTKVPLARAASMMRVVSWTEAVKDFSTNSALPASIAARAIGVCCGCGVAT